MPRQNKYDKLPRHFRSNIWMTTPSSAQSLSGSQSATPKSTCKPLFKNLTKPYIQLNAPETTMFKAINLPINNKLNKKLPMALTEAASAVLVQAIIIDLINDAV